MMASYEYWRSNFGVYHSQSVCLRSC